MMLEDINTYANILTTVIVHITIITSTAIYAYRWVSRDVQSLRKPKKGVKHG